MQLSSFHFHCTQWDICLQSLYKDVKSMYELKRRHRLVITGVAPHETGLGKTDFKFNRAELQFIYQVNVKGYLMLYTYTQMRLICSFHNTYIVGNTHPVAVGACTHSI